jgi:hypothetical protein
MIFLLISDMKCKMQYRLNRANHKTELVVLESVLKPLILFCDWRGFICTKTTNSVL